MNFDDLRKEWQGEVDRPLPADQLKPLLVAAQQKYSKLERTVYWRDLREIAAAMLVMVLFAAGWHRWQAVPMARLGSGIIILWMPVIAYKLVAARRSSPLPLDASVLECSRERLKWLDRQIQLLETIATWYVAPIFVGVVLFDWALTPGRRWFFVFHLAATALLCALAIFMNRRAVRKQLLPIREELVEVIAALGGAAEASRTPATWRQFFKQGREIMRRPIPRLVAATTACLLAFAIWSLFPDRQPDAHAFEKFAKALVEARSATFDITDKGERFPEVKTRCYYLAPQKLRREVQIGGDEQVIIEDFATHQRLVLRPNEKTATLFNERDAGPKTPWISDLAEQLRGLLAKGQDDQYKPVGEMEIDGRRAVGFRWKVPMQTMTLWGDPATGLPVLIERLSGSGPTPRELTMSHFKFNEDLKPELFNMTPPQGYTYRGIDKADGEGDKRTSPLADKLNSIAVAMLNYKDAKRAFPPAAISDPAGLPLLSWRVRLLPYLGEGKLYNQFHLNEPWDSEHNLSLAKEMPDWYAIAGADKSAGKTTVLAPIGDKTIFFSAKGTTLPEITDPLAGTILLVVADDKLAVPWTKPEDLIVDPKNPAEGLARENGFFLVAWADGQVIPLPANVDAATLWAYFTRAGGEKVEWPKLPK